MTMEILKLKDENAAAEKLVAAGYADGKVALNNLKLLGAGPLGVRTGEISAHALKSPWPDRALTNLERIVRGLSKATAKRFLKGRDNLGSLITISGSSNFLSNIMARDHARFTGLFLDHKLGRQKDLAAFNRELAEAVSAAAHPPGFDEMARILRLYTQGEYLRIGSRDLLGLAGVIEVTAELSDLACACLEAGLGFCHAELEAEFGTPVEDGTGEQAQFAVIGLGKLGGRELNFSSDIDIIYLYSTVKGETTGIEASVEARQKSRIGLHDFYIKLSERLTRLISRPTSDGVVFRVDLDLRPDGRSGPLANSLGALELYYESWGRTWERSALIKARHAAGSRDLSERFLDTIRPFVYRRNLDYSAIEEIKSMKEKIDLELMRTRPGAIDVKLGRGGIREIEFFCQALQLIHGGKVAEVREPSTLGAITKLEQNKLLGKGEARSLAEGYVFLRNIEHRIQIVEGRQSHAVPGGGEELNRLSRMMGFLSATSGFNRKFGEKTERVYEIYRKLFYGPGESIAGGISAGVRLIFSAAMPDAEATEELEGLGYVDAPEALRRIKMLRTGPPHVRLSARARTLVEKIGPYLVSLCSNSPDPDMALMHTEAFMTAVGARAGLYSVLAENPALLLELIKIFGSSVFLSRALIEHPVSIELLLSAEMSRPKKSGDDMAGDIQTLMDSTGDYEQKLDELRRYKNQEVFRIGTNNIIGNLEWEDVSGQMSSLAEAAIGAAYALAQSEIERVYGSAKAEFTVIGLGKLGGRTLSYGSDLDIVFVYSDTSDTATTTGPKKVSIHEFFVLLAQRMISVLTLRTREGIVFSVDTRLRPSGSAGPLVVSRSSFIDYQNKKAAVWERQALTRARVVAGDEGFGREVLAELESTLYRGPLTTADLAELRRIRKRMETELAKENTTGFNIKTGRGGLVDIEYLVQTLQLHYGKVKPALRGPDTLKAIDALAKEGIIDKEAREMLVNAYGFYRTIETRLRIVHDRAEGVLKKEGKELNALARGLGFEGEDAGRLLLDSYKECAEKVRSLYGAVGELAGAESETEKG